MCSIGTIQIFMSLEFFELNSQQSSQINKTYTVSITLSAVGRTEFPDTSFRDRSFIKTRANFSPSHIFPYYPIAFSKAYISSGVISVVSCNP